MRWLPARKRLEFLAQQNADALLVVDGERLTAPCAEPEVFDVVTVRGKTVLPWDLLKTKKTSLAIIKIGRAFRMGAFQIHQLRVTAFLMGSHTHLKGKIRFSYRVVKLI